ncbi:MAG: glucose-1-phosphate adenylyltransferase [Candidatus Omnitrophica bacterium CG11_big_fil_rev_8_21_14_0_20_45_26]|uniref:Glucose-1-phosphate adenylyltransferase n=1 Tax=Candidatus Abzuiibacterium crystallinum TaxID=1974748 RepID=A0A2H0LLR6_9BACT|nr:MAG: glucose-1-phosphate adenylyltransferase [Candidatus Omnitrophica bacterium CG11_big_fil_rev_8_21_14_0_20_45_26]PIW63221.1 MAG: glucose-1-phosphate adenylyltransferase [Candidatus Omnitrophica bacterium CG12_big_fil_rev_8_21_14_0_65_45_16]
MRVVAIVLGGGQGKRLFPLTRDRSKPAVPIGGKYRLVDIPISHSLQSGIRDIFVLTQFNSSSLNNHILNTYKFDYFSRSKVTLLAAEQTLSGEQWFQGTADAVRCHLAHYHLEEDDTVLILSGDHLYRMNFRELIAWHEHRKADVTLSVIGIPEKEVQQFGILKAKSSGLITSFLEKPGKNVSKKSYEYKQNTYLASMGIYVFKARVLIDLLRGPEADFGKELIPRAIKSVKCYAYHFPGYWRDIGTIRSYYQANLELTGRHPKFRFHEEDFGPIFTHPRFLPSTRINQAKIINSLITEGSVIEQAEINHSVVGLRTIIRKNVKVSNSVIIGADFYEPEKNKKHPIPIGVGEGSVIENAIIDKNARIGKGVMIRNRKLIEQFDSKNYYIRDGIVIIPRDAIIPNHADI